MTDTNLLERGSVEPARGESDAHAEDEEYRKGITRSKGRSSKGFLAIVGAVIVAALLISTLWVLPDLFEKEVVVVAILPLTGASSYLIEIEESMALTVEKLNRWGGLNGLRIRLVVIDCESSPEVATEKLLEAEEKYHPLAVVTATRGAAIPMSEIAEEKGIVLISIGASPETITEGKDWIFRYYITSSAEVDVAMDTIGTLGISSLGILYLDDAYGVPIMDLLSEEFEDLGGIVETSSFVPTSTEFSQAVANLTDNDAVFIAALRHHFPLILAELNESGYDGYILGAVEASIPDVWELPEAEGVYASAPILYNQAAAVDVEFLNEFEEQYGRTLTHQGAIGSDVLDLIWGLLSDRDVTRDNLRIMLSAGFAHSGILGVVTLASGDKNVDIPLYRGVIEGGELQYLSD